MRAARFRSRSEVIKLLIESGCDSNIQDVSLLIGVYDVIIITEGYIEIWDDGTALGYMLWSLRSSEVTD